MSQANDANNNKKNRLSVTEKIKKGISKFVKKVVGTQPELIENKTPEGCVNIILHVLNLFEEIDQKEHLATYGKSAYPTDQNIADIHHNKEVSMGGISRYFLYFLLNMSLDDFHRTYVKFYKQFDKDNSLFMEEKEFSSMIEYLALKENLGYTKLTKCLEKVAEKTYTQHQQLDALFESVEANHIGPNVVHGMFEELKFKQTDGEAAPNQEPFLDYLKVLPLLICFFSDHLQKKIKLRKDNLEIIRGIDDARRPITGTHISLFTKLEGLGINYSGDDSTPKVGYRTLEKALILFRNAYTETLGNKQLQLILGEVRTKMEVGPNMIKEKKEKQLKFKFLTWLAYRICLHSSLSNLTMLTKNHDSVDKHSINEEYTYWCCTIYSDRIHKQSMKSNFLKHIPKILDRNNMEAEDNKLNYNDMELVMKLYLRKYIPHLSSESISKMAKSFKKQILHPGLGYPLDTLAEKLYDLLIEEAKRKLSEYINKIYERIDPDKKYRHVEENKANESYTKNEVQNLIQPILRQPTLKNPKELQNTSLDQIDKNPSSEENSCVNKPDNNDNGEQEINQLNTIGKFSEPFLEKKGTIKIEENPLQTKKTINFNNLDFDQPDVEKPKQEKKDILNSLFLMESFVERIIYQKGKAAFLLRNSEDLNPSSNDSFCKQEIDKKDREYEKKFGIQEKFKSPTNSTHTNLLKSPTSSSSMTSQIKSPSNNGSILRLKSPGDGSSSLRLKDPGDSSASIGMKSPTNSITTSILIKSPIASTSNFEKRMISSPSPTQEPNIEGSSKKPKLAISTKTENSKQEIEEQGRSTSKSKGRGKKNTNPAIIITDTVSNTGQLKTLEEENESLLSNSTATSKTLRKTAKSEQQKPKKKGSKSKSRKPIEKDNQISEESKDSTLKKGDILPDDQNGAKSIKINLAETEIYKNRKLLLADLLKEDETTKSQPKKFDVSMSVRSIKKLDSPFKRNQLLDSDDENRRKSKHEFEDVEPDKLQFQKKNKIAKLTEDANCNIYQGNINFK